MLRSPRGKDTEGQRRKWRRALGSHPNFGKNREKEDLQEGPPKPESK